MTEMRDRTAEAMALTPAEARALIRANRWTDLTEAVAQNFVHVAPVVLPAAQAAGFREYCAANPLAAPVVAELPPGVWETPLAPGGDVRTDVVRYQIWAYGQLMSEVSDLLGVWRDDLVTFLIGTSHILASGLKRAGISDETVDNPRPAIYRTGQPSVAAGGFSAPLHVTVKFATPEELPTVVRVSGHYPAGHGAPVHAGDPAAFLVDGEHPAFGHQLEVPPGRVPVFWACSFTALSALRAAKLPWFACNAPGCTFILDVPVEAPPA